MGRMSKKFQLWFYKIVVALLAIGATAGVIAGIQPSRAYDERTYILVLSFILLWLCGNFLKEIENTQKN